MYFWNSGSNGEDATVTKVDTEKRVSNGSNDKHFRSRLDSDSQNNKSTTLSKQSSVAKSLDKVQDVKKAMQMLRDFAENTSLPGIPHVYSRVGWNWKLFWLVISVGAAAMAIIQSWRILNDFVGGKTIQSTSYSTEFEFPSITICSNIRLHYRKKGMIDDLDLSYLNRDNFTHLMAFVDLLLLKENETGDDPFGPPLTPKNCIYNQIACDKKDDDEIFHFDTPLYGNCFTYNIGTKKPKDGKPNYFLTMKVPMDKFSRRLDWNDNFIQVWLHPPGTAPVLYRHEGIRVYPGDSVDIKFQMKKITRLPKKGNPCLDQKMDTKRFESIYYTENDPYLYSSRACAYTLLYEGKKELYACMDPAIPRNIKWRQEWQSGHYNMCLPGTAMTAPTVDNDDDDESNNTIFDFDANCTFPCSEWMVEFTMTSISAWFEAMVDRSLRTGSQDGDLKFENRFSELKIGLGSPMTEEVSEDYKYTISDFAGILGGNVGIWIGLSVISLAEVVELSVHIGVLKIQQLYNWISNIKSKPKDTIKSIKVKKLVLGT